jgi:branched-chain amino acid transport system permease protein
VPTTPDEVPTDDTAGPVETSSTGTAGGAAGIMTPAATTGERTLLQRLTPGSTLLQHALLMLLAFVGIALLIETLGGFRVAQLAQMGYYIPAVAGLTLLTGINGQISLGHGALMAVGAYTTAVVLERYELPFSLVLLLAVLITGLVGIAVGAAASRLHGPYLAGATLALAVGLPGLALYSKEFLGGEQGLRVSPP